MSERHGALRSCGTPARTLARGRCRRRCAGALVALVAVLAAGCGGNRRGADAEARSVWVDPCKLFTPAELRRYLNVPPETSIEVGPPRGVSPFAVVGMDPCQVLAGQKTLYLGVARGFPRETFAKFKREASPVKPITSAKGVGTEAVWFGSTLVALDDHVVFAVDMTLHGEDGATRTRRMVAEGLRRLRERL